MFAQFYKRRVKVIKRVILNILDSKIFIIVFTELFSFYTSLFLVIFSKIKRRFYKKSISIRACDFKIKCI